MGSTRTTAGVAVNHYIGVLGPTQTALRDRINGILRDAMRDGRLEAILRRWNVWNDDQPPFFVRGARRRLPIDQTVIPESVRRRCRPGSRDDATVSAVAAHGGARHARAVVPVHGARRAASRRGQCSPLSRRVYGRSDHAGVAQDLRRGHAWHADPAAAVRHLLRVGVDRAAAGVRGRTDRPRAELRSVRERDLSRGARGRIEAGSSRPPEFWVSRIDRPCA